MIEVKIYCLDISELADFESSRRGFRSDIYVVKENHIYQINVYDIHRLQQDFELELITYGFFSIEPNLILTKEVTLKCINNTIAYLANQGFFNGLKPTTVKQVDLEKMIEVTI